MFNLKDNKEAIVKLIDSRESDEFVIPVYVRIYNNRYFLHELDQIKEYNPTSFKIGFGSSSSLFVKNSFPNQLILNYEEPVAFTECDENTGVATRYVLFEANDTVPDDSDINKQIIFYAERIREYLEEMAKKRREELLKEQMEDE